MLWNDLRDYLKKLDQLGMLERVRGAHWDLEIGVITELMVERGGPALLFDEVPDYPKSFGLAANLCTRPERTALALGLNHERPLVEMAEEWNRVIGEIQPIPMCEVYSGPVFDNTLKGGDVDLFHFPTPRWHDKDIDRYIGTGLCVIQRDPDTGFVNSGSYRVCIADKNTCGLFMEPNRHGDFIRRKHWSRGEKCPVVVSVGQEPILTLLSGGSVYHCPNGVSEFEVAGYLHKSPYPVVKGPITGLPIPATAEIAIEGFIPSPEEKLLPEGPFGEWTGYYGHGRRLETVIEVAAIHYREGCIIFGSPPIRHIRAYKELTNIDFRVRRRLEQAGIQGVQEVVTVVAPGFRVVKVKQMYAGHVEDVIRQLEPGGDQHSGNHIWVLVDEDIDLLYTEEVLWAIASRCIPESGVTIVPGTAVWQLDPRIPPGQASDPSMKGREKYNAHNLVINACRPYEWKDKFPEVNMNSRELRRDIEKKWKTLFAHVQAHR